MLVVKRISVERSALKIESGILAYANWVKWTVERWAGNREETRELVAKQVQAIVREAAESQLGC